MSRFSIVFINDNAAEYCVPLFQKLSTQLNIEVMDIILIDNCSSDNSVEIARSFGVQTIYSFEKRIDNRGVLYNKGADLAKENFILFSHTDVIFSDDFFVKLALNLDNNETADFIAFPQIYPDKRVFGLNELAVNFSDEEVFSLQPRTVTPPGFEKFLECSESCFMIHRDVMVYFRFDENYKNSYFEYNLLKNVLLNGGNAITFPESTVTHYFIELHEKYLTEEFDQKLFKMKNVEMFRLAMLIKGTTKERVNDRTKIIYHVGAWGGNFGDSILQQSARINLTELAGCEIEFRYINCQQTEFTPQLISDINESGDLLLIGGGGLVFYRPQDNSKSGWQWNIDINLIDNITVPIVFYGIGYNQFEYDTTDFLPITNKHLQKTVEKATLFSVRNQGTKRDLVARGCNPAKITVIPDSGMFLQPKELYIPRINEHKVKIGFNWTTDRQDQTFPAPSKIMRDKFLASIINVLNRAIREKNAQIVHIGHMGGDFDREIIEILKAHLIEEPVIIDDEIKDIYPPSGEKAAYLVDVYRQMDIVLGMRGHANIVAFGQNTPSIGLGSHRKLRYFLEDIGKPNLFFDVRHENMFEDEVMARILFDVIDNLPQYKEELSNEFLRQRSIFDEFNLQILNILNIGR